MCLFTLVIFDFILKASMDTSPWDSSCMAARQVGIYSAKGVNCTTLFEGKENVRVEAIALIKGPFPFRTPVQIEKVKSNLYSQPEVKWLKAKAFKNSKRHWKAIEISRRHSISLLTISSIGRGGGGGTPLYKPHRYVPPVKRYGFWAFLVWKRVYTLPILVRNRVWFSKELRECMNVFVVSLPNK